MLVRWLRLLSLLTLIVTLYFLVPVSTTVHREEIVRIVLSVAVFLGLAVGMVRLLRLQIYDSSHRIDGLVAGIALVVVVFAYAFYVLNARRPDELVGLETRLDALYFAVTTLTTVGYGDVYAAGQLARALVLTQMVFNVIFIATAATVLSTRVRIAAEARGQQRRGQQRSPGSGEERAAPDNAQ